MTLLIAFMLIYGLELHWSLYIIASILWLLKKTLFVFLLTVIVRNE